MIRCISQLIFVNFVKCAKSNYAQLLIALHFRNSQMNVDRFCLISLCCTLDAWAQSMAHDKVVVGDEVLKILRAITDASLYAQCTAAYELVLHKLYK